MPMTPLARDMMAALAIAMLASASPATAALPPAANAAADVAPGPTAFHIDEPLFASRGQPSAPALRVPRAYAVDDGIEIERKNLRLAPPGNETLRLFLAGATGGIVVALLFLAMLCRRPGEGPLAGA